MTPSADLVQGGNKVNPTNSELPTLIIFVCFFTWVYVLKWLKFNTVVFPLRLLTRNLFFCLDEALDSFKPAMPQLIFYGNNAVNL